MSLFLSVFLSIYLSIYLFQYQQQGAVEQVLGSSGRYIALNALQEKSEEQVLGV